MSSELIGKTLENRYHFEQLLGEGTFAEVYRITDLHRRASLAAKVLRSDIARDTNLLERFQREATVLARLQHPNIVRYYDVVVTDGYRFILMDYIPGQTLDDVLQATTQPIRPQASLAFITPLASALHFAHNEGIIHRDLKPANILLHENGTLYVTDFGIARLLNVASQLTMDTTLGTPLYMAPEQITGEPISVATDIYALGVLLYRMYTGRVPFRGASSEATGQSTATRITYEHINCAAEPPAKLNPSLDLAIQEIVLRCLEKKPARRYASISDLYDALAEAVGAPPIAIDTTTTIGTGEGGDLPPDIKLPEWSQFIPPVADPHTEPDALEQDHASIQIAEPDDESETLAPRPVSAVDTIEHPAAQPETRPNLESALQDAGRTIPHQPQHHESATVPHADRFSLPHPTPRHLPQPPQQHQPPAAPYDYAHDEPPRRNWTTIAIVTGVLLVLASLCLAVLYLSGMFGNAASTATPRREFTLTGQVDAAAEGDSDTPQTAGAETRQGGTRIVFDSRRDDDLDIYIMDADGSNQRQLTGTSGAERGPAWSPDGAHIAFYGALSENDNYDIYVIDADGSNLRNLTQSPDIDDRYPAWSPDGTRLAFHSNRDGDFEIYVINLDGTGLTALTDNDVDDLGPDWSPDGTQIAFHTSLWDFPYELAILDLNTGQIRRLTNNNDTNTFPTWSPDGTQIAYNAISSIDANANIYIMQADGTGRRQITNDNARNTFPDWSPDGTQIIYQRGNPDISATYTIPVAGGTPTALTGQDRNFLPDWEPYH